MTPNPSLRNGAIARWWHDEVVYEIYVQSFYDSNGDGIGDLNGIVQKLGYLKDLGIGCIWLSPIMESPFMDCGYDVSNHYAINPYFGTMADFDRLLMEAHGRGIRVILDFVPGYTSDQHGWFSEARKSRSARTRDYYVWAAARGDDPPNNWFSIDAAGPAWTYNPATSDYFFHAFLPEQPQLNWNCNHLVTAMLDVMRFWLEKGIDGFRVDAVNYMIADDERRNNPGEKFKQKHIFDRYHRNVHGILRLFRDLSDEYPDQMMVGEVYPGYPVECKEYYGRNHDELHLNFNFALAPNLRREELYERSHPAESGEEENCFFTVKEFREAIQDHDLLFRQLGLWPTIALGNHDDPRVCSSFGSLVGTRFRDRMAKLVAGFTLLAKGTPFLYYGEEIGMENMSFDHISEFKDTFGVRYYEYLVRERNAPEAEALRYAHNVSRDVCRTPMQWDGTVQAGFSTNPHTWLRVNPDYEHKNVSQQLQDPNSVLSFYKHLIGLRKRHPSLTEGEYVWVDQNSNDYIAFLRKAEGEVTLVLLNFSERNLAFSLDFHEYGIKGNAVKALASNCRQGDATITGHLDVNPVELLLGRVCEAPSDE